MPSPSRLRAGALAIGLTLVAFGPATGTVIASTDLAAPKVVHIVVDSLDPDEVGPTTPTLQELRDAGTWWEEARAVMASETLPNHVAMGTGTYAGRNGIPGNDGRAAPGDTAPASPDLGVPAYREAVSLTTAIEDQCPDLRTVTAFSKSYVYTTFAEDGADHDFTAREREIPESGHVPDADIASWVAQRLAEGQADYVFLNLGDVDRAGHVDPSGVGPFPGGREAALRNADAAVRLIVEALKSNGQWADTVVIVNSDHTMDYRGGGQGPLPNLGQLQGVDVQGALDGDARTTGAFFTSENGGAAMVYLLDPDRIDADQILRDAREIIAGLDGVDDVLYREPNPLDAGNDLAAARPAWNLHGTDRAGELFVTVEAGQVVGTNPFAGNHGHAVTRHITALVTGGWGGLAAAQSVAASQPTLVDERDDTAQLPEQAEQVDWAPTIGWLLGVDDPGGASTPQWQGRQLSEAFAVTEVEPACVQAAEEQPTEEPTPDVTETPQAAVDDAVEEAGPSLPATGGGMVLGGLALIAGALLRRRD